MLQTAVRGGVAGAIATVVMTLEQSLDKRLFDSKYDDVEILGKLVEGLLERHHHRRDRTRNPASQARLQHWSSMSAVLRWNKRRPNASIADLPRVEMAWRNPGALDEDSSGW